MSKYRNKKVQVDMYVFDSIAESRRYKELKLLEESRRNTKFRITTTFFITRKFQEKWKNF